MRKILLFISMILFATAMNLQAQETVPTEVLKGNWATLVGGQGMDMVAKMTTNQNGDIIFTEEIYSSPAKNWFSYGETKFDASGLSGKPNGNPDFAMHKVDKDGKLLLTLRSDRGYYSKSSPLVATKDGGYLLALKLRTLDEGLVIPEDNGKQYMFRMYTSADPDYVYTIEDNSIDPKHGWVNKGYILKLDKDGKVQWRKDINTDTTPVKSNSCSNMFELEDAVEGPDGCYYILGRFARPLNIEGAPKQFVPENIPENWDYDFVQNAAGDLFVTKYDAAGNYKWTLTHTSATGVTNEGAQRLAVDNEAIYVMGHIAGTTDSKVTFGNKTMAVPSNVRKHLFFIKVNCFENLNASDNTVKVDFVRAFNTTAAVKPMFVLVDDNKIITGGSFKQGAIFDGENKIVEFTGKQYQGYTLTASTTDGKIIAGTVNSYKKGINEIESAHLAGDSIYVYGYTLGQGGWIAALQKETLEAGKLYTAFTGGGFSTAQGSVLVNDKITVFGRGRQKPFVIQGIDGSTIDPTIDNKDWDILVANFTLNGINVPAVVPEPAAMEKLTARWAVLSGGQGMDQAGQAKTNHLGETFFTQDCYTGPSKTWYNYAGGEHIQGSAISTEPNGNPDFVLQKLNIDGEPLMTLHSDRGYFDRKSPIVPTSDGGVILVLKLRSIDKNRDIDNGKHIMFRMYNSNDPSYVYTIEEPNLKVEDGWVNKGYVVKINKFGRVEWRKDINTDTTPVVANGQEESCADMFEFNDAVEGPDKCLYILGKFARPLNIEGAKKQFIPDNIPSDWDYDYKQHPAGDMFITKFDAQGNYQWTLTHQPGSMVANEGPQKLAANSTAVFAMGHLKGAASQLQSTTFGDKTVAINDSKFQHQFVMKIDCASNSKATDSNVTVDYLKLIKSTPNSKGKVGLKPMCITANDDIVAVGGGFYGSMEDGGKKVLFSNMGTQYHGYTITLSAIDGTNPMGTEVTYDKGISEVEGLHIVNDSIYATGYTMQKGGWISAMDKTTLETGKIYSAFTGGGFSTVQGSSLVDNKITVYGRGREGLFNVQGIDSSTLNPGIKKTDDNYKDWEVLVCNFMISAIPGTSSVESIEKEEDTMVAYGANGHITIIASEEEMVNIYNVSGMLLKSINVVEGSTSVEMPQGFYIVNGHKVIVY